MSKTNLETFGFEASVEELEGMSQMFNKSEQTNKLISNHFNNYKLIIIFNV
jgi:hypothetical protein